VLRNADRHRTPGTPITLRTNAGAEGVRVEIANQGPHIAAPMLERIFEYGVSDAPEGDKGPRRGQGLFVARTYMSKMGGTISAANVEGGVVFTLLLPRG
jgi:signal transduction histidine kinase